MSLSRHAEASGFYAWFEERDLMSMRQWFHTAAKLDRKWYQMEEDKQGSGFEDPAAHQATGVE